MTHCATSLKDQLGLEVGTGEALAASERSELCASPGNVPDSSHFSHLQAAVAPGNTYLASVPFDALMLSMAQLTRNCHGQHAQFTVVWEKRNFRLNLS